VSVEVRLRTDDFRRWLLRAQGDIVAGARNSLAQAVGVALRHAQSTALFKDRTGELRRSIVRFQASTWRMGIKATADHAKFVEYGTKDSSKGPIVPVRAQALRFVVAGRVVFRKSVKHKGMKATHFMQKAGDEGQAYLERALERVVRQAFR
jgi:hypothetical protein